MSSGGDWNKRVAWAMECAILAQQVSTVQLLARTRLAVSVPVRGWLAGLGWAGTANTGPEKGSGLFSSPPSGMLLRQAPSPICADSFPYELAPEGTHTVRKGAQVQAQALDRASRKWFKINKIWNALTRCISGLASSICRDVELPKRIQGSYSNIHST
jgi:hypothetical protein